MAWTVTDRGTGTVTSGTSVSTAAFTPGANKLLVCAISNAGDFSSMSGHGTWVNIASVVDYQAGGDVHLYGVITSGTPSSSAVTVNLTSTGAASIAVIEIDGADVSGAVGDAIGVSATANGYNGSGTHNNGVTLAAFADSDNMTLIMTGLRGGSGTTYSAKSGFTLHNHTTTDYPCAISTDTIEDSSPYITSTDDFINWAGIGCEVIAASAAAGNNSRLLLTGVG